MNLHLSLLRVAALSVVLAGCSGTTSDVDSGDTGTSDVATDAGESDLLEPDADDSDVDVDAGSGAHNDTVDSSDAADVQDDSETDVTIDDIVTDADATIEDVPSDIAADLPLCEEPGAPYGTAVGRRFSPFTFDTCESAPFSFYGEAEGYCEAPFTLVTIGAGWCGPCRLEAEQMQELITEAYSDRGLRVVVALIQDNNYGPPSPEFCRTWVEQYGLTNPVLLDPFNETAIYFPEAALPASVIVDSAGVIVYREYGVSDELESVRARLDELMPPLD